MKKMSARWNRKRPGYYWLYPEAGGYKCVIKKVSGTAQLYRIRFLSPDGHIMPCSWTAYRMEHGQRHELTLCHTLKQAKAWAEGIMDKVAKGELK